MKKKILIGSFIVILVTAVFFTARPFVTAQVAGQGLEVSPPSQEIIADPGKTTTVKAKIRNRSNTSLPIQVHIEDFTAKGDDGQVALTTDSPYSVASWTTVAPSSFTLGAGEEQEVVATITVPEDGAGGRFGSFVFGVQPETKEGENTASVSQEIASLFLVRISGDVTEKLSVTGFSAPSYNEFGPVPLTLQFMNAGNVHVKAYGLINVTDMFGNKVADIVVPGVNIFPNAERNVTTTLDKKFLFGPYHATALLYYGSTTQNLSTTTSFFVFPTRIVVGIVVVLLVLIVLRKRMTKKKK